MTQRKFIMVVPWELRGTVQKARLLEPYAYEHALFTGEPQPSRVDPDMWIQLGPRVNSQVNVGILNLLDQSD